MKYLLILDWDCGGNDIFVLDRALSRSEFDEIAVRFKCRSVAEFTATRKGMSIRYLADSNIKKHQRAIGFITHVSADKAIKNIEIPF